MNKRQSKFLSMCLTLCHFYTKYEDNVKASAILMRLFEEFFSYFNNMQEAVQVQKGHTTEAAKLKQKEEEEMIQAVCRNASKGYVYATERNLPGLKELFNISPWELEKLGDVNLYETCMAIYTAIVKIAPEEISEYGIEPPDVQSMKKEIDDFYALISRPRATIITRSQATAKIEEEMKKLQALFADRLDRIMNSLPESQRVMYNEYRAARMMMMQSNNTTESTTDTTEQPKM
jgi:hypothetical protein